MTIEKMAEKIRGVLALRIKNKEMEKIQAGAEKAFLGLERDTYCAPSSVEVLALIGECLAHRALVEKLCSIVQSDDDPRDIVMEVSRLVGNGDQDG